VTRPAPTAMSSAAAVPIAEPSGGSNSPSHSLHFPETIMFTIRYQTPYNSCEWRMQTFSTLSEAERMVNFYISCGSPAHLVTIR
jgi:hypothetical protein